MIQAHYVVSTIPCTTPDRDPVVIALQSFSVEHYPVVPTTRRQAIRKTFPKGVP
jgi:hypothetical protein